MTRGRDDVGERRLAKVVGLALLGPLVVWLQTPGVMPRRWRRWLMTCPLPVAPLLYTWDAVVSHLRTYTCDELDRMMQAHRGAGYVWDVGQVPHPRMNFRITCLVAWPKL